ncbi:MAG: hypothetical protein ACK56I_37220, partial [bacterium]
MQHGIKTSQSVVKSYAKKYTERSARTRNQSHPTFGATGVLHLGPDEPPAANAFQCWLLTVHVAHVAFSGSAPAHR